MEKMLPFGAQTTQTSFDAITEYTKGIGEKQLRNIRLVIGQVVIVGAAQLDVGVF